jgi:hypothetical protein
MALEGGEGSASRPGRSLPTGKTRYPFYRRLGGPQGRSGQVRKISPTAGFDPRTVQPIASRYTDWATQSTRVYIRISIYKVAPVTGHYTFNRKTVSSEFCATLLCMRVYIELYMMYARIRVIYATTASFHIPSNSLRTNHPIIWRYIIWVTNIIVQQITNHCCEVEFSPENLMYPLSRQSLTFI